MDSNTSGNRTYIRHNLQNLLVIYRTLGNSINREYEVINQKIYMTYYLKMGARGSVVG
jgi:hypothetical protein